MGLNVYFYKKLNYLEKSIMFSKEKMVVYKVYI
jgi:hypothetical protein